MARTCPPNRTTSITTIATITARTAGRMQWSAATTSAGHAPRRIVQRGFTVTEILVIIGVIAVLVGVLLTALGGVRRTGQMAESMNSMRQIATWMQLYSSDNRETILPSQFDYSANLRPGLVRSVTPSIGNANQGTWTDILWTIQDELQLPTHGGGGEVIVPGGVGMNAYEYDSPDDLLYDLFGDEIKSPLRSTALNSRDYLVGDGIPTPFGNGAFSGGRPGFFAANNFFNATPGVGQFYSTGQIRAPERSVYLVDSVAGETIDPLETLWDTSSLVGPASTIDLTAMRQANVPSDSRMQIDFRYNRRCLMLFLDGHVDPVSPWGDLCRLERNLNIRVRDLTARTSPCP